MNDQNIEITIQEPSIDLKRIIRVAKKNWWLFAISLFIALFIAVLINRYTEPVYEAKVTLIKESSIASNDVQDVLYGDDLFGSKTKDVLNEIALLSSYDLIEKTLKELGLSVSYFNDGKIRKDELYNESPIFVAIDTSNTVDVPYSITFRCKIVDTSHYTLSKEPDDLKTQVKNFIKNEPVIEYPFLNKKLEFGKLYNYGTFRFSVILDENNYSNFSGTDVLFVINKYENLLTTYRNRINVYPYTDEAAILNVSIEGTHKQKLLDYLNRHIYNFINGELSNKNQMASKTIEFINNQILAMSDSLSLIESQLETLKKSNSSLNVKNEPGDLLQSTRSLEDERNMIMLNNEYLGNLQSYLGNDQLDKIFLPSSLGISDPSLNRSIEQLVDLRLEIEVMESDKNLSNPLIRIKRQQIEGLKNNIVEIVRGLKEANDLRLNGINNRLQGLTYSMQSIPTAERKLENIERMHQLSENMYLFLMQKKAEAGIARASNSVDYRVIDKAKYAALRPIKPKPMMNFMAAIILGFIFPGMFVFVKELMNTKIETKKELERITSIPILGTIPLQKTKKVKLLPETIDPVVAESLRMIRSNIRYLTRNDEQQSKVYLVTSSVSGEGKSFCSLNLALLFSNFGKRVLFLSLDMRKVDNFTPLLTEYKAGLSEFLSSNASISDIIYRSSAKNLSIIPSGGIPPNPTELLLNGRIDVLLESVRQHFDYIILDSPPIGIIADAMEVVAKTDLNIYVVRADYTKKEHVKELNEKYHYGYIKNIAILMNAVHSTHQNYNYGDYSYYRGISTKKKKKPARKVS